MLKDEKYIKRLDYIREYVRNKWKENKGLPARYTIHDARHSQSVEDAICKLIPEAKYSALSEEERFYLLSSAWLHDIGMIPDLFGRKDDYQEVRQNHHRRCVRFVDKERQALGLDYPEAKIIGEICRYHTKSENIAKCEATFGNIRLQLLAAYLRLADALHVDRSRVDESLFKIFLEVGMPWDSKYHWLKSFWIKDIFPDSDNLTITIQLLISVNDDKNVGIISNMIEQEVRTELHTVRDILIRGGISYFLDVKTKYGLGIEKSQIIDLKQIIGNIQLERKPSASEVMDTIVNTTMPVLEISDKRQSYSVIKTYKNEVVRNVVKNRPCHMLVSKIDKFITEQVREEERELADGEIAYRVNCLRSNIERFRKSRQESLNKLLMFTKGILAAPASTLLFGYSNLVLKALDGVESPIKNKSKIYVCECASKNQYNALNELVYCDGIEYASRVRQIGYKQVYLVPDILVGNLISRGLVSRIIFGANGVDIKTGTFGHTAGHLTIADLAYLYKIPIFVIVDSDKFGVMHHDEKLERENNWLTGDKKALSKLEGVKLFNPRQYLVDADKIYALVTDYGIFPASKIPSTLRRKVSRKF